MGKSAKVHKRTKKQTSNDSAPLTTPTPKPAQQPQAAAAASAAAKKAKLKGRLGKRGKLAARSGSSSSTGHRVLGGADYVDIMMGSRRREREEAKKLPPRET